MKILLFHYDVLDEFGGVEAVVCNLAKSLRARGHTVDILEMGREPAKPRELFPGITLRRLLAMQLPRWKSPRSWLSFARTFMQLQRALKAFDPDVVHVHFPARQAPLMAVAALLPRHWRLVATLHNSDIWGRPADYEAIRPWRNRFFQRTDQVTAVCKALLAAAEEDYPCITGKGRVIYNGISDAWLQQDSNLAPQNKGGNRYILYAGRLSDVKGVDILLTAWAQIHEKYPDTQLMIIGDGPQREALQKQARESGLTQAVQFLPATGKQALAEWYRHAECLILPSSREGQGLVLVEASLCHTICIGSNVVGINEVLKHGENGFLFPYGDHAALAGYIGQVLDMEETQRQHLEAAAYHNVRERFMEPHMIDEYVRLYEDVCTR